MNNVQRRGAETQSYFGKDLLCELRVSVPLRWIFVV